VIEPGGWACGTDARQSRSENIKAFAFGFSPDDYLSFLTTLNLIRDPKWTWLRDSLLAELSFRGLKAELALLDDQREAEPVYCERKMRPEGSE
jgi:hypothetical protein